MLLSWVRKKVRQTCVSCSCQTALCGCNNKSSVIYDARPRKCDEGKKQVCFTPRLRNADSPARCQATACHIALNQKGEYSFAQSYG